MTAPPGGPRYQPLYGAPPHGHQTPPGYPAQPGYPPPSPGYPSQPGYPPGYPQPDPTPGGQAPGYPQQGPAPGRYPPPGHAPPLGPAPGQAPPPGYPMPGQAPPPGYPPAGFGPPPGSPPGAVPGPPGAQGFGPPAFGQAPAGPGGPPLVVDVGKTHGKQAAIGAIVAGVIGLIAVISGLVGAVDGGTGAAIVAIVIGALFLLPAIITVAMRNKVFRPRSLVFEPAGVRWDDPQGAPWAIPWGELAAVAISKHIPRKGPETVSDKISGAVVEKALGERAHVRLDLYPADPGFAGRHPEMAHLWERQGVKGGYRLPLGANVRFIPQIAQAMGRFAPNIYRGVVGTEGIMGLS